MKITVQGLPGEGKTTLALYLAEVLMSAGFGVNVEDVDVSDLEARLGQRQQQRMEALRAKELTIDIVTCQAAKAEHLADAVVKDDVAEKLGRRLLEGDPNRG